LGVYEKRSLKRPWNLNLADPEEKDPLDTQLLFSYFSTQSKAAPEPIKSYRISFGIDCLFAIHKGPNIKRFIEGIKKLVFAK
jgi:hypothetical protein